MGSITAAQKAYLKTGKLEKLGSKNGPNEFNLDATTIALVKVAGTLVEDSHDNLQAGGHVSSGKLTDSIRALDPEIAGKNVKVDVEAATYYSFLNKGVRGTKAGTGQFVFKTDMPSVKMVNEIQKWIKRASFASANVSKPISKLEVKRKSISALNRGRRVAFATARAIKQFGIAPTGFFDKAVQTAKVTAKEELAKGLKLDILNSLPDKLG